ncbi:DUF1194 domain-containing protein [Paracoccus ravus]|uniref:DUF1194 domain-containing protein n=1 Tax=Paracoccus ravus TaxID=2447760 RepID=UPI001FD6712D|nr:DUF1194 domain-containing protein [Paracoccus ravus]
MKHSQFAFLCPLLAVTGLTGPVHAQSPAGDLGVGVELVLAVDISRSIDPAEQAIQRRGYAEAFRSVQMQKAILLGDWKRIAVTYVEWAGAGSQTITIPWTLIDSPAAAEEFAGRIESGASLPVSRTSISGAIDFAAELFEGNGYSGGRRVIDVSGDGPNNQGRMVTDARDAALARGITINGLPLQVDDAEGGGGWSTIPDLDRYYIDCVIGGMGAFSIAVTDWDQFAAAVRRKLVLEVAGQEPVSREAVTRAQVRSSDCLVGERRWEDRQRLWAE